MPLFDADYLRGCEGLVQRAKRTWGRKFLGRRLNRRLASGTEVTGYTDYTTGHDLKYVDWNRCARLDELVSKQFHGSELNDLHLLVDCSGSMQLGQPPKADFARRLAGALGYVALANGDNVTTAGFADQPQAWLGPVRGRESAPRFLSFLESLPREAAATNLRAVAETFSRGKHRTGLVVLVSDLFDPDPSAFAGAVDLLRRQGFQPFVVQVFDPLDVEPNGTGPRQLCDSETGRRCSVTLDETDLENYRQVLREYCDSVRQYCSRYSVGLLQTRTDVPFHGCLEKIFRAATYRPAAVPVQRMSSV